MSATPNSADRPPAFPVGGGETGALIAAFDWSQTSLGPITGWPESLRTHRLPESLRTQPRDHQEAYAVDDIRHASENALAP